MRSVGSLETCGLRRKSVGTLASFSANGVASGGRAFERAAEDASCLGPGQRESQSLSTVRNPGGSALWKPLIPTHPPAATVAGGDACGSCHPGGSGPDRAAEEEEDGANMDWASVLL